MPFRKSIKGNKCIYIFAIKIKETIMTALFKIKLNKGCHASTPEGLKSIIKFITRENLGKSIV